MRKRIKTPGKSRTVLEVPCDDLRGAEREISGVPERFAKGICGLGHMTTRKIAEMPRGMGPGARSQRCLKGSQTASAAWAA